MRGFQHLPLCQREARSLGHLAQAFQLFRRRFFVHAKQQRPFQVNQFFGGGDVGKDHAFFDQLMRVKAVAERHRQHLAFVRDHDLAFGQFKIKRLPRAARRFQRGIGGVKGAQHRIKQRFGLFIRPPVNRVLHLRIVQRPLRAHQAAGEAMADLVAMRIDLHHHRHAGAVDMFVQRTQIARQHVGQHRHHAVGEIG